MKALFQQLQAAYGPQHWWPGDTPFEVMVGAILTQNTAWHNASRAIERLKASELLDPVVIAGLKEHELAPYLRSAGYFRVKARRLRALCQWLVQSGGHSTLRRQSTARLRRGLLAVHGVGPETADAILLYAFERPVFVVDAYTYRLFGRWGLLDRERPPGYEALRASVEHAFGPDAETFNEFHALIVEHGKTVCRTEPLCDRCPVAQGCGWFANYWASKV